MEFQQAVAQNIKAVRERKKLTLDAAAKLTGVSRSMLAQIEKGDVNPTISVLWKIANGYKTSFSSLVDAGETHLLIRAADMRPLPEDDGRYILRPAFPFQEDSQFETYMVEIQPGGSLQAQPHMSGTEEFITVFAGAVEVAAGGETFCLHKGDSLRFKADTAHAYRCLGDEPTHLSMIIHYSR